MDQERLPFYKSKWLIVLMLLIVVPFLLLGCSNSNYSNNPDDTEIKTISSEEDLKNIIHSVVREKTNNDNQERIISLSIQEDGESGDSNNKIITANLLADSSSFGNTKFKILMNSAKISEKIFKDEQVSQFILLWDLPLVDAYGNVDNALVARIVLSKDTANLINWENLNYERLPEIADEYFEHNALSK
ncbi:hypothetical protein [Bacillus andreraoultii]|uniref:hypothetical protein n=1 Tax=Bacillus andreraoultii TaxID=1499685 RepID=UPI00053ABEFE|nr:hypothetical protein [Bacillus andreraoultii]